MAARWACIAILLILASTFLVEAAPEQNTTASRHHRRHHHHHHRSNSGREHHMGQQSHNATNWAVLVAGSSDYSNYRHQADVCHAYQVLRKNGLKDENIIVFMYDDIAYNEQNPHKGVIINRPNGPNVYSGVPKDYTGDNVTAENFFNVLLGNKSALTGGSGKVVESGPNDNIFVYYSDHGSPGIIETPNDLIFAKDFINVLKKKHESNSYAQMVIFLEACNAGSMFEGLLPESWNIYATTASNATEESYSSFCMEEGEYKDTCLGDLYSDNWMEYTETKNLSEETLEDQFRVVRNKTTDSHVMEYGNKKLAARQLLSAFLAAKSPSQNDSTLAEIQEDSNGFTLAGIQEGLRYTKVAQRDIELHLHRKQYGIAAEGSEERSEAEIKLATTIQRRQEIDNNMRTIVDTFFVSEKHSEMLSAARPAGKAVVEDWDCLKSMVRIYEERCGKLMTYGLKYTGFFGNVCNAGIRADQMESVLAQICS